MVISGVEMSFLEFVGLFFLGLIFMKHLIRRIWKAL